MFHFNFKLQTLADSSKDVSFCINPKLGYCCISFDEKLFEAKLGPSAWASIKDLDLLNNSPIAIESPTTLVVYFPNGTVLIYFCIKMIPVYINITAKIVSN